MMDFFSNLKRTMTRKVAKDAMNDPQETSPLGAVRSKRKEHTQLIERLRKETLVPEEDKARVLEVLALLIQEHFKAKDISLVLLGSAAHGGGEIKKQLNDPRTLSKEIDYAVLSDTPLSQEDATQIHEFVVKYMPVVAERISLENGSEYHPCGFTNAILVRTLNIFHPENLAAELVQVVEENQSLIDQGILEFSDILDEISEKLVLYFHPSFPEEANKKNIESMLQVLRMIYQYNSKHWEVITQELERQWKIVHRIKDKHLTNKKEWFDKKSVPFIGKVGQSSSEAMVAPFVRLLESSRQ